MLDQDTCARPVVVTLPGQITTANAERAAGQISAAFTPGVSVVVADLTCTACRDRSAIRHLLRVHRTAAARAGRCDSRSALALRCAGSPILPTRTRCSRSTPPSSTP
jgi:hypothetical protein